MRPNYGAVKSAVFILGGSLEKVASFIFRGPRPKSYRSLKKQGITHCVNLQSGAEDLLTDSPLEFEDPKLSGIKVIRIPCSDIFPPTATQVRRFLSLCKVKKAKLYVHCHSGVDRTGFMIAAYRMQIDRWSYWAAHAEWLEKGRHWWFWWWKFSLKNWERE